GRMGGGRGGARRQDQIGGGGSVAAGLFCACLRYAPVTRCAPRFIKCLVVTRAASPTDSPDFAEVRPAEGDVTNRPCSEFVVKIILEYQSHDFDLSRTFHCASARRRFRWLSEGRSRRS